MMYRSKPPTVMNATISCCVDYTLKRLCYACAKACLQFWRDVEPGHKFSMTYCSAVLNCSTVIRFLEASGPSSVITHLGMSASR